ncbi:MAG: exodeoxyribonuclease VII small subunit [SAR202 cluster bacterium Io17-Chloro-G9]|nr:MAG: exodeoxyribonuclease VII small subunit [SAR202 cluster bacterium Io17-Chloro-G9]
MADSVGAEPNPEIDSLTFEQAFQTLGEMAESLEAGGLTLAEATARYEQGMILVKRCNQLLDQAELKITNLKDAYAQDPGGLPGDEGDEEEE